MEFSMLRARIRRDNAAAWLSLRKEYESEHGAIDPVGLGELLWCACGHKDLSTRVELVADLLQQAPDLSYRGPEGQTALHHLMDNVAHDSVGEAGLVAAFREGGADINALTSGGDTPLELLAANMALSDEELMPIYNAFFDGSELDLESKNLRGISLGERLLKFAAVSTRENFVSAVRAYAARTRQPLSS